MFVGNHCQNIGFLTLFLGVLVSRKANNFAPWGSFFLPKTPLILLHTTLFPKRNATLISRFFMVTLDQGQWLQVMCTKGNVQTKFGPKFSDLQSSPKERQLQKSCVSFGEECRTPMISRMVEIKLTLLSRMLTHPTCIRVCEGETAVFMLCKH